LARQLLTESIVTSAAGGACGTALAIGFQRFILYLVPVDVPGMEELGVSWSMLGFALAVSTVSGILFGIMPALQATRVNVADNIKSGTRATDARGQGFHSSLVVAQVAISLILLIGSGLLLRSFATLSSVNPGFDTQNLLTTEIRLASDKYPDEAKRIDFFSDLTEDLRAIPGVTDVAVVNRLPVLNPGYNPAVWAADKPPPAHEDRVGANRRSVLPGYFDAMGILLLRGRGIEASDSAQAPKVLVINETMARKLFPNEDPLGRPVKIWDEDDPYEVVGIVGDVRVGGLQYAPRLTMYGPYTQQPTLVMRLAIRTAYDATSLAEAVRNVVWSHDRDVPVAGLTSMDEIIARTVSNEKVVAISVTLFASVAVLLAAFGLYGVLAYYVSLRTHEIGICMALGANAGDIIQPILGRGLKLVATGIALGLVGAFWVTRLFQQILFEVAPTDATTYVVVSFFFAAVAIGACLIPARKALRVDPVTALAVQ
jgi:putative ABC transport system permease protein